MSGLCSVVATVPLLAENHYLGPTRLAKFGWQDGYGVMLFSAPRSRRLPHESWLELVRWCLVGKPNGGSRQWAAFSSWAKQNMPDVTTIVSYSDPQQGHTGALYRACNWLWAPTWHRLRPPPSGNGQWCANKQQHVKDRWVYPLQPDPDRQAILGLKDSAVVKRMPWAEYHEGTGGDYKRWQATQVV